MMSVSKLMSAAKVKSPWLELEKICQKIHVQLYENRNAATARRSRARLEQIIARLPENDLAILKEEGLALLHELHGDLGKAIKHRKREVQLIERLHKSVAQSIENGDFDSTMGTSILKTRSTGALKVRRKILADLEEQRDATEVEVVRLPRSRAAASRGTG